MNNKKKYLIAVTIDEDKLRDCSVEPDNAAVEEMIYQVVNMKLSEDDWFSPTGITVTHVFKSINMENDR